MENGNFTKKAFVKYVDTATTLAELVKSNVQKDGIITNETVIALNEFIIASNAIKDLTDELHETDQKYN